MEFLGLAFVALVTMVGVYFVVYFIPIRLLERFDASREKRRRMANSAENESRDTFEIHIALHAK